MRVRILPIVTLVFSVLAVITMAIVVYHIAVPGDAHAQGKVWGMKVWESPDQISRMSLYKIQDGNCTVYVISDNIRMAIATGQGCK